MTNQKARKRERGRGIEQEASRDSSIFFFHLKKRRKKRSPDKFIKHGALAVGSHSPRRYISRRFYTVDLRNKFRERFATLAAGRLWNTAGLGRRSTRGATGWKGINPPANSPPKIIHSGNTPRALHTSIPATAILSIDFPGTRAENTKLLSCRSRSTVESESVSLFVIGESILFQSHFLSIEIPSK